MAPIRTKRVRATGAWGGGRYCSGEMHGAKGGLVEVPREEDVRTEREKGEREKDWLHKGAPFRYSGGDGPAISERRRLAVSA